MTENALAVRQSTIKTYDDLERAANAMATSGYFADSRQMAQAVVKILAGQEMGFGPFASMTGIYIIQGRPAIGANLMAAAVKASGRYDYRVTEMTDTVCTIKFFQHKEEIGVSKFTLEDAKKAQTKNLDKFPRNMLFARAMSNGVRWYCPDVFAGAVAYTPEELGASVNEDGDVITIVDTPAPVIPTPPAPAAKPAPERLPVPTFVMTREDAENELASDGTRYGDMDSADLEARQHGIAKGLNKSGLTVEQKETYKRKSMAINVILGAREAEDAAAHAGINQGE